MRSELSPEDGQGVDPMFHVLASRPPPPIAQCPGPRPTWPLKVGRNLAWNVRYELGCPHPYPRPRRQARVHDSRHRTRPLGRPNPTCTSSDLGQLAVVASAARQPLGEVLCCRKEVSLLVVADGVGRHQVVEGVVRVARPRDEVVDLGLVAESFPAIEAAPILALA